MSIENIPPYQSRPDLPTEWIALAVVYHQGRVLVARRRKRAFQGGLWEFPGGKREALESYAHCAVRETKEECDLDVQAVRELPPVRYDYPSRRVVLQPYLCRVVGGEARPLECEEVRWVAPEDLPLLQMPDANGPIVRGIVLGEYLRVTAP